MSQPKTKIKKITIYLDPKKQGQLKALADYEERSLNQMINILLDISLSKFNILKENKFYGKKSNCNNKSGKS